VRRNDEVAAQRRRWTFYETINSALINTEATQSVDYIIKGSRKVQSETCPKKI
jgi:hypothetical protein